MLLSAVVYVSTTVFALLTMLTVTIWPFSAPLVVPLIANPRAALVALMILLLAIVPMATVGAVVSICSVPAGL